MKRLLCALLLAALCLGLTACLGGAPTPAAPSPEATPTPTPAPAPSPEATPGQIEHPTDAAVFTDWSGLTTEAAPQEIYTRLTPEPMETLRPGDYGALLPFSSSTRFATGDGWGWELGGLKGLVTAEGMIVLDPVCSSVSRLVRYSAEEGEIVCPFLVLEKLLYDPDAPDAGEWNRGWVERCAVCAEDGSWCTDFVYTNVLGSPLGALCVRSEQENLAECLSARGRVVFDTKDWDVRAELAPWSVTQLNDIPAEGWAPVQLNSGRDVFLNARGAVMPMRQALWIEIAEPFSEGLAAVRVDGLWGFLDERGALAIEPQYSGVGYGGFLDGYTIVYTDGRLRSAVIDRAGNVVLEDETIGREVSGGVGWYHCFASGGASRWYDASLDPVEIGGNTPSGADVELGFYYKDKDGVRVLTFDGAQRFYPGAETVSVYDGYVFAYTADECQVFDPSDRPLGVFPLDSWPSLRRDERTGEAYIYVSTGDGCDVYSARGEYLLHTRDWSSPRCGLFYCWDDLTTGYKNAANEWVFRVRVDSGD